MGMTVLYVCTKITNKFYSVFKRLSRKNRDTVHPLIRFLFRRSMSRNATAASAAVIAPTTKVLV